MAEIVEKLETAAAAAAPSQGRDPALHRASRRPAVTEQDTSESEDSEDEGDDVRH